MRPTFDHYEDLDDRPNAGPDFSQPQRLPNSLRQSCQNEYEVLRSYGVVPFITALCQTARSIESTNTEYGVPHLRRDGNVRLIPPFEVSESGSVSVW